MSELKIRTNNHFRPFRMREEVPAKVLKDQFDYLREDDGDKFLSYKGTWYHVSEFMRLGSKEGPLAEWDGSHADSAFSGVLIKVSDDGETYKVGRFYQ